MKALEIKQATAPLADYVRAVGKEPVIVSVKGKPVAALVSIENADWETVRLSSHPEFLALIERSRTRQKKEGGISSNQLRRRLRIPLAKPGLGMRTRPHRNRGRAQSEPRP
jgi:prevent-host-death family protein